MGYATAYGLLIGARRAGLRLALPSQQSRHAWNRLLSVISTNFLEEEQRRRKRRKKKPQPEPERIVTLAIETSCDDTCVAVLEKRPFSTELIFNAKLTSDNRKFGGVEPITAVESHSSQLAPLIQAAAEHLPKTELESGLPDFNPATGEIAGRRRRPDFITVTRGPGLTSALSVGLTAAKGLAAAWQVPLVAIHHMQAHALTPRLVNALTSEPPDRAARRKRARRLRMGLPYQEQREPDFPFLSLLVSGGHTQLLLSKSVTSHTILAESLNVAIGDMLDKCARVILPADILAKTDNVMYGARLESFAFGPPPEKETVSLPKEASTAHEDSSPAPDESSTPPEDPFRVLYDSASKPSPPGDPSPPSEEPSPAPKSPSSALDESSPSPETPSPTPRNPPTPLEDPYEALYGYVYKPPLKRREEMQPYVSPTYGWTLTPPLSERRDMAFDFSGLGGQVQAIMKKNPDMDIDQRRELARETMRLAFEHLGTRILFALDAMRAKDRETNRQLQCDRTDVEKKGEASTDTEASPGTTAAGATTAESTTVDSATAGTTITEPTTAESASETAATESTITPESATKPPTTARTATAEEAAPVSTVPKTLVVAGGVAANRFLQHVLTRMLSARGYPSDQLAIVRPPTEFCTDNAAMVAWAGLEMWESGWYSDLNVLPQRRWPLDDGRGDEDGDKQGDNGEPRGGILALGGWLPRSQLEVVDDEKVAAEAHERALNALAKEIEAKAVGEEQDEEVIIGPGGKKTKKKKPKTVTKPRDWTVDWEAEDWNDKWGVQPDPSEFEPRPELFDWAADWHDWNRKYARLDEIRAERRREEAYQEWLERRKSTEWVGKLKKRKAKELARARANRIRLRYQ